ncbi:hypothetical protein T12_2539 [Trichinella patagoniensis]|uniref:Uncharacterized protein n=1 Tax=Trichinella patagoniensis TaxID=990121 RepID=A0A0V0Z5S3_9BILA|nr:hypothetical protein T12_2539 [Trichinella patagoniensis]
MSTTHDSKFSLLTYPSTRGEVDCRDQHTNSATLSKEEFFQVKQKKRSNNIMLSAVAKNGIIESILLIEAIWPRSVEDNNLRHRYEVLRIGDEVNLICKRTVDYFKMIAAIKHIHNTVGKAYDGIGHGREKKISRLEQNFGTIMNENTLKTPDLDDHQLEADKKLVESNEGIEETKRDEQAVEADVKSTLNEVIETVGELTVTCSGQCSDCDDEKLTAERVRSMNKNHVIVPICEVSSDGRGQPLKRNKATKQHNDIKQNGILAHICLELASGMDMYCQFWWLFIIFVVVIMLYCYAIGTLQYCLSEEAVELGRDF